MIKKILYITVAALVFLALIALLWLWLKPETETPSGSGSFGAAGERPGSGTGSAGSGTNLGTSLPGQGSGGGSGSGSGSASGGVGTGGSGTDNSVVGGVGGSAGSGSTWIGSTTGSFSGAGRVFTPSEINQLNSAGGGLPFIAGSSGGTQGGGGLGLGESLLGAGIAGAVSCSAFLLTAPGGALTPSSLVAVQVNNSASNSEKILNCLTRVIARVALDQMTRSIVQWINSGFNGKPSFVQNYNQFFTNVADQAAGEFIRGSGLAFLCSPFRPQVRIAIAQAYANRGAQSCSLTKIIGNANSFLNGNFSSGGWGGFLSLTTMPINNPYGSYAYGQISLGNYQATKLSEQASRLQQGQGFLPVTKKLDCTPVAGTSGRPDDQLTNCREIVVTPGRTVADAVSKVTGNSIDTLNLAKNFDEIINALISQLLTRTLYNGLGGAEGTIGGDLSAQAATNQARGLLSELQAAAQLAQQYGSIGQGAIRDIQQTQQNFNNVYNCWSSKGNTANASSSQAQIDALELRVASYNTQITKANSMIAKIQDLQTQLSLATSAEGVQAVASAFAAAKSTFLTQNDISLALQDRQTLQSQMQTLNNQAQTGLNQCNSS